jgi:hypothetical protein
MASKTTGFLPKSRFALPKRRIESRHLKLLVLASFPLGLNGALASRSTSAKMGLLVEGKMPIKGFTGGVRRSSMLG